MGRGALIDEAAPGPPTRPESVARRRARGPLVPVARLTTSVGAEDSVRGPETPSYAIVSATSAALGARSDRGGAREAWSSGSTDTSARE